MANAQTNKGPRTGPQAQGWFTNKRAKSRGLQKQQKASRKQNRKR